MQVGPRGYAPAGTDAQGRMNRRATIAPLRSLLTRFRCPRLRPPQTTTGARKQSSSHDGRAVKYILAPVGLQTRSCSTRCANLPLIIPAELNCETPQPRAASARSKLYHH